MRNDNDFFARILKAKPEELAALKESIETYYGQPKIVKGTAPVTNTSIKYRVKKKRTPPNFDISLSEVLEMEPTDD